MISLQDKGYCPSMEEIDEYVNNPTFEDAVDELKRVEELENAKKEMEKINGEGTVSQKMFRAI